MNVDQQQFQFVETSFDRAEFDFHRVEIVDVYLLLSAHSSQLLGKILLELFLLLHPILVEF